MLRLIPQPKFATDLLDARLDLLDMIRAVITFPDNDMQMRLAVVARVPDALLEDRLGLFNELAVQVDGVARDFADRVVLAEDVLGRLLVVCVGLRGVSLALLAHLVCACAIALLVRFARLGGVMLVLALFFAREVPQAVVFALGIGGRSVVEGCEALELEKRIAA